MRAGAEALKVKSTEIAGLEPLQAIRALHLRTCEELKVGPEATAEARPPPAAPAAPHALPTKAGRSSFEWAWLR